MSLFLVVILVVVLVRAVMPLEDDGRTSGMFIIRPMIWRELDNFSSGSVCMVLASNRYDEDDYYRDYEAFIVSDYGEAIVSPDIGEEFA